MDTEPLERLGLTKNESLIYLTLIELGKSQVWQLATKTKLHRRTIYDCLERLEDRGFVSYSIENGTKFFKAANPQKCINIIKETEDKLNKIIPELIEKFSSKKTKTEVTVFNGKEGLKSIMEDLLRTKPKKWFALTSSGKGPKLLPYFIPRFHEMRIKNGTELITILGKDKYSLKRAEELKKLDLTKVILADITHLIPISVWLYNHKLVLMLWDAETGIIIENEDTNKTFKNFFDKLIQK